MIKKSLFAVVILALLVVTTQVQAGDLADPNNPGFIKIDEENYDDYGMEDWPTQLKLNWSDKFYWPGEWEWSIDVEFDELEICQIPVMIEVGIYAELKDCNKKKITMKQVDCSEVSGNDFPCYKGCTNIDLRANAELTVGTKLYRMDLTSDPGVYVVPSNSKWKAKLDGAKEADYPKAGDDLGDWSTYELCVEGWDFQIFYVTYDTTVQIGEVAVTVKPEDIHLSGGGSF